MPAGTRAREQGLRKYQALTNISVPEPGENKDKRTFMVPRGGTVELTEDQAHNLMTQHRVPVIRSVAEGSEPMPIIRGMSLSGRLRVPAVPASDPNYDGPRPDPEGSSHIQVLQGVGTPESSDPQPGTQNALDIPPGTRVTGGITQI
jgi:hypothetical protein